MTDQEYAILTKHILRLTEINLDNYKSQQMRRRLSFFIESTNNQTVVHYCKLMENDPNVLNKLKDFLTINVTEFFRDDWAFQDLQKTILPILIKGSFALNVWSAGCSNGSEPYSIAILLKELTGHSHHKILGTDLDNLSLEKAISGGPYTKDSIKNAPEDYIREYYNLEDNKYWIKPEIKKMVRFKKQNLLADRFEEGFHLICCRNVTIYFTDEAKANLTKNFYNSLFDKGVLFIGATEFIPNHSDLGFKKLGTCFYQKIAKQDMISNAEKQPVLTTV